MTGAKILIIDDEQAARLSLREIVESHGLTARDAASGEQALELIKQEFYDLLLVDYQLPDMTGIDIIKQSVLISPDSVPLIVTGSNATIETAVESMRLGVHDYLMKPVNPEDLLRTVATILKEREDLRNGKARLNQTLQKLSYTKDEAAVAIVENTDKSFVHIGGGGPLRSIFLFPLRIVLAVKRFFWDVD